MASRSTVTASATIHHASARLRDKVFAIAAHLLECATADLELRDGSVGVVGVPGATVSLQKVAQAARPGWENPRPEGVEAGLEETHYWQPPTVTWSYAVHVAIVEVDREIGRVGIDKYAVAHDCGVVVTRCWSRARSWAAPRRGSAASSAKRSSNDTNGQLLSGSLMDYALPTASDIPAMQIVHQHSPSPLNPLGVKGVGEGGAVAAPAAIANAVCDALAPFGVEVRMRRRSSRNSSCAQSGHADIARSRSNTWQSRKSSVIRMGDRGFESPIHGAATHGPKNGRLLVSNDLTLETSCTDFRSCERRDDHGLSNTAERCSSGAADAGEVVAIGSGDPLDYAEVAEPAKLA